MDDAIVDRARGALFGLAVGDALGTTLEFSSRDRFPRHTEMTGGGPFRLEPGQWTDDTSMALALADSLIKCGKFDAFDLMKRFVSWWREGEYSCTGRCFDIGGTTSDALARFERTRDPFAGSTDETSAGNGSLMRLAPVVLFAFDDAALTAQLAVDQSRTTHAAVQATEACAFFAALLQRAIAGEPKDQVLATMVWNGHEAVKSIARGDWRGRSRDGIRSSGYVIDTLEAALWAVEKTDSFEDALILAVNLADDADSVGAVTGQLAGALYGASNIPERWSNKLAWRGQIMVIADNLFTHNQQVEGNE
jgi:ADP-ribosyl-[dinitrogen reductase] hydrolase